MTTDKELFNLCKEVYERTDWETDEMLIVINLGMESEHIAKRELDGDESVDDYANAVPAYSSDYLLEKLPRSVEGNYKPTLTPVVQEDWRAAYDSDDGFVWRSEYADTPLKALLKLVIALDDAGVKL